MVPRRTILCLCAAVALLAAPRPAAAQTAGGLKGVVLDKGAPLVGATVAVLNPALAINRGGVTDGRGEWRVVPLPPGSGYTLSVSFPGMATVTLTDVEVAAGQIAALPITLRAEGEVREKIKVVGRPDIVNLDSTTAQTSFSAEFIEGLPILGRNYQDLLTLAPGVSDVDGDGNPNIHGARDTDVVTLVDGVSTGDPLTGKFGQRLNLEAIQEIEVKTSGAGAEFSRAQGGFVTVHTKSGGNEFEGKASFHWRSHILDGDGAGSDDPRLHGGLGEIGLRDLKFADYQPFVSLAGPIRKDRAWYFVIAEYIQEQEPVNALTQAFVRSETQKRLFGKATWDISTNHNLVFTATYDPQRYDNQGIDSFTTLESGYTEKRGGTNLVLKERAIFSPNLFLETTLQSFNTKPGTIPTINGDTNGNGTFYIDRNDNQRWDATETDPGKDWDSDGAWDVFEKDPNNDGKVGRLERASDRDGDFRYTPKTIGCEGDTREDKDCDGHLDDRNEDKNGDGIFQSGSEDLDGDRRFDDGTEDKNKNALLDDRPFPSPDDVMFAYGSGPPVPLPYFYPYESARPFPGDRDYMIDHDSTRVSGALYTDHDSDMGRITLRQDLTAFVPEWRGQHELKIGGVVERETYTQQTRLRPILIMPSPPSPPPTGPGSTLTDRLPSGNVSAELPAEEKVFNTAENLTVGFYLQDTYKPLPNLTLGVGVRFDREATDSFGYNPFDPGSQRVLYDRIWNLGGGEIGRADQFEGNGDGISSQGYCSDPIFARLTCSSNPLNNPVLTELSDLRRIAPARLTQHHTSTTILAKNLESLFPEARVCDNPSDPTDCRIDREVLRLRGSATFQEREAFRLTNNNLAPRLYLSWDPWSDSRTKVFLNWSRYFDKLFLSAVIPEEGPDSILRAYVLDLDGLTDSGVPNNSLGAPVSKAPPGATQVDRGLQTPFSDELTIGFERELAPEVAFGIRYIQRKYRQQLQDVDVNHYLRSNPDGTPRDVIGQILTNGRTFAKIKDGRPDLYIHNFFFNEIFRVGNYNDARYRAIVAYLTRRLSRRWQLDASYTYSRAVGAAESFQSDLGNDPAATEDEFGYLDYDERHSVKLNLMIYLPHDWRLGTAASWSSGLPYSTIDEFVAFDNFDYGQFRQRYLAGRRNSERNRPFYDINLRAEKALVLGRLNSKIFLTVDNLLNTDDLTIHTYRADPGDALTGLQLDAERRFGRRFQTGFQIEF